MFWHSHRIDTVAMVAAIVFSLRPTLGSCRAPNPIVDGANASDEQAARRAACSAMRLEGLGRLAAAVKAMKAETIRPAGIVHRESRCYSACILEAWAEAVDLQLDIERELQGARATDDGTGGASRNLDPCEVSSALLRHDWERLESLHGRVTGQWVRSIWYSTVLSEWRQLEARRGSVLPNTQWTFDGLRAPCSDYLYDRLHPNVHPYFEVGGCFGAGRVATPMYYDEDCSPVMPSPWPRTVDPTAGLHRSVLDR